MRWQAQTKTGGIRPGYADELHFERDLRAFVQELPEQGYCRLHFRDAIAKKDDTLGRVDAETLNLHQLLYGAGEFLRFLNRDRVGNRYCDGNGIFDLTPLWLGIVHDHQNPRTDGHD
ncbi:MAG: hypothetical protein WKF37_19400, partial [Bryobacteraceae bacterium]